MWYLVFVKSDPTNLLKASKSIYFHLPVNPKFHPNIGRSEIKNKTKQNCPDSDGLCNQMSQEVQLDTGHWREVKFCLVRVNPLQVSSRQRSNVGFVRLEEE